MSLSPARVLIIAGSDPSGGAGIQGDIKTVTVLGGYAMAALTALTVQNTLGVSAVHPVPPALIAAQVAACLGDIGADAIKLGMLGGAGAIAAVADALTGFAGPVVLDPVMVAKGGARLLDPGAEAVLRAQLLPRATIITPNAPELAALSGRGVATAAQALAAGHGLARATAVAVMVKGGHLPGDPVVDTLILPDGSEVRFTGPRIDTPHTHGTGCALASAIATGLAQGLSLAHACARAHAFVAAAIAAAPGLGGGCGPLGHAAGAQALGHAAGVQALGDAV